MIYDSRAVNGEARPSSSLDFLYGGDNFCMWETILLLIESALRWGAWTAPKPWASILNSIMVYLCWYLGSL